MFSQYPKCFHQFSNAEKLLILIKEAALVACQRLSFNFSQCIASGPNLFCKFIQCIKTKMTN